MAPYSVVVHGTGFDLTLDEVRGSYGFYVTRFVDAEDPEAAVQSALELLRREPRLRGFDASPPKLSVDTVERLADDFALPEVQPGWAFYFEDGFGEGAV